MENNRKLQETSHLAQRKRKPTKEETTMRQYNERIGRQAKKEQASNERSVRSRKVAV
jgi:hypothetical protein